MTKIIEQLYQELLDQVEAHEHFLSIGDSNLASMAWENINRIIEANEELLGEVK